MVRARVVATGAGLGCVLAALSVVPRFGPVPMASADLVGTNEALVLATAIAGPGAVVTGAELTVPPPLQPPEGAPPGWEPPVANGISDLSLAGFPRDGADHGILTTGAAASADDENANPNEAPEDRVADDDTSTDLGGGNVRGDTDYDVSILRIDLAVPATANCLSIDFKFFSEEFPDWVDLAFNDAFVAELDQSTWLTEGSEIRAPDNFAFAPDGDDEGTEPDVVTVNAVGPGGFDRSNAAETTYDGATEVLSAATPVTAGSRSVYLSIFDQGPPLDPEVPEYLGDHILDSAVFLDNLRVGYVADPDTQCVPGATVKQHQLDLTPATHLGFTGETHEVVTTLQDLNADPPTLSGAPVRFAVTGANPLSTTVTTDADGRAALTWTGTVAGTDTVTACYDADASGVCDADEPFASATADWEVLEKRRVAFTDDRDEAVRVPVTRTVDDGVEHFIGEAYEPLGIDGTRHTGEASAGPTFATYVSTVDDRHGEVYLSTEVGSAPLDLGAAGRRRITCANDAVETQPTYASGWVAWASDIDGDWEIYVGRLGEPDPDATPVGGACSDVTAYQLTDNDADDLWPAWSPDGNALFFSSTVADPYGDIYRMVVDDGEVTEVVRQTDSEAADTQPAALQYGGREWLAFTTTRFRSDGSVAFARARTLETAPVPDVVSAWGDDPPLQSDEPAWAGESGDPNLAFTSRARDPYGDVWVADLRASGTGPGIPAVLRADPVADRPGVAESHPSWADEFEDGGVIKRAAPAWALRTALPAALPVVVRASLVVTVRSVDADVSDVLAEDGSQRRRVVPDSAATSNRLDEAGPDYSPDGERLAFSRTTTDPARSCTETWFSGFEGAPIGIVDVDSAIRVPRAGRVTDVDVRMDLEHPAIGDLDVSLGHGDRTVMLTSRNGGDSDDFRGTVFDDEAGRSVTTIPTDNSETPHPGPYVPEQPLSGFDGTDGRGSWVLRVLDAQLEDSGTFFAWSVTVTFADCATPGREIATSDADGHDVRPLATGRLPNDVDSDPVWSPDGTEIAFVRQRWDEADAGYGRPEVWVAPVDGSPARQVTQSGDGRLLSDEDPTWSPDGRYLVVARDVELCCEEGVVGRRAEPTPPGRRVPDELWVLDAAGTRRDAQLRFTPVPDEGVAIRGRSPAWSPDGTTIAYDLRGALRLVDVTATGPVEQELLDRVWPVTDPRTVTGFTDHFPGSFDQLESPTPARAVLAATDDPAWRSDGQEIAVAGQPAGQPDQRGIWAIRPDGTGLRMLTDLHPRDGERDQDARGPETEPAWEPLPSADLAVTLAVVGSPAEAGATITATYTVTNNGPTRAQGVTLTTLVPPGGSRIAVAPPAGCLPDGSGCSFPDLAAGDSRSYVLTLSYPGEVSGDVVGTVGALTPDPFPANNTALVPIDVSPAPADVGVTVVLDDPIGYVGGQRTATVTVTNHGPGPAAGVTLRTTYPDTVEPTAVEPCLTDGTDCALGDLAPGAVVELTVDLAALTTGTGSVVAEVATTSTDLRERNDRAEAELEVLQPTIRLLPEVARPGQVVLAFGEDMPPGSLVRLAWKPGITVDPGPFRVGPDGTVQAYLLLIRHDQLGERVLRATSATGEFSPVKGRMLAVLRTVSAPQFVQRG